MRSGQEDQTPKHRQDRDQRKNPGECGVPKAESRPGLLLALFAAGLVLWHPAAAGAAIWRGLTVAPENRCSEYDRDDYQYSRSVEDELVKEYGGAYSPYTGEWFAADTETDIEHMVALSEAHDSGMCARSLEERREFSNDLLNLTLSSPSLNRFAKSARDAAEWLPDYNYCWFASRIVQVKTRYRLSVDRAEAEALEGVLQSCAATTLIIYPRGNPLPAPTPTPGPASLPVSPGPGNEMPAEPYPWEGPLTDVWLGPGQAMLLLHAPSGAAIAVPLYFDAEGTPGGWSAMTGQIEVGNYQSGGGRMTSDPGLSKGKTATWSIHVHNPDSLQLELLSCTTSSTTPCADPGNMNFTRHTRQETNEKL